MNFIFTETAAQTQTRLRRHQRMYPGTPTKPIMRSMTSKRQSPARLPQLSARRLEIERAG